MRLFTIAPVGRAACHHDLALNPDQIRYLMEFIAGARLKKQMDIK